MIPALLMALTVAAGDTARSLRVIVGPAESLHVEIVGAGEPVLLLPGLFGSAFTYRKVIPLLTAAGYRSVIIEPLGIGTSSRPARADYSLDAQAARIAAALDTLGLKESLVIAHSLGGAMAFRVAYQRPDLVRGLVSLEGGPTEEATTPAFRRALRFAPLIKIFGGMRLIRHEIRKGLVDASGDASWVTDDVVRGYTAGAAANLGGTLKALSGMAHSREHEPLRPHLSEVQCPVRLVIGTAEHDGDVGTDEVSLLARSLPAFAVDSVAGAGHYLQEEQPRRVALALEEVRETLSGHSRPVGDK